MRRMMRRFIAAAGIAVGAAVPAFGQAPANGAAVPVEVQTAKRGALERAVALTGRIEPRADAMLFAEIPGRIIELRAEQGDRVKKGQPLAVVEQAGTLAIAVQQAETQLRAAELQLRQAQTLSQVRYASQREQANAALTAAQAALDQVRELAQLQTETQIAQAEAGLDALRATFKKIREGARIQERQQSDELVKQAEANLQNAERNYKRIESLFESAVVSQQAFDGAKTQLDVAKAQYEIASQQKQLIEEGARTEDIQAMEAQVRGAEAALELAKARADVKTWEKEIAAVQAQVAQAEALRAVAQTAWEARQWETEIALAETARDAAKLAVELAKKHLDRATVYAPFNGVIAERYVDVGDHAVSALPGSVGLFRLLDVDVVFAVAEVSETDLPAVSTGQIVTVNARALSRPVEGTVRFVSPTVNPQSHAALMKVEVANGDGTLKPGMFAEVTITSGRADSVLIPRSSVLNLSGGEGEVFIVSGGKAIKRRVKIGLTRGSVVSVASGLSEGEQVVVGGQTQLRENAPVRIVTGN